MRKNCCALAVAWLLPFSGISAAPSAPFIVDVPQTENELPQSSVIAMTQTHDGYLWLGTLNGLVRFDGTRFTVFDEGSTPGLNSGRTVYLFEDSHTNLWVGTEAAGVALIKDGQVSRVDIGRGSREGRLMSACEDSSGAVWFYTADGQLCRYANGRGDIWQFGAQYPSNCRAIIAEKSGPLWVGVDWGLYGLRSMTNLPSRELPPVEQVFLTTPLNFLLASKSGGYWRLADGRVQKWRANRLERDLGAYPWTTNAHASAACEDHDGNLIVGTLNEGVFWYGTDGKPARVSSTQGLTHDGILSLCVDREGSLWVGTDGGGLNRVKQPFFNVLEESRGLTMQSVCEDNQAGMWIGWGGGATYFKDGNLRRFGPNDGLDGYVLTMLVDRAQRVWAGTRGRGLFEFQTNRFQPASGFGTIARDIFAIHEDRKGNLWLGTDSGLVRLDGSKWKVQDGLPANIVKAITDDAEGNLWIGTDGGGLNQLRDGHFTSYRKQEKGLPSDRVSSLYVDQEGVLWIGTDGGGLARYYKGGWTRYTKHTGLVSNGVGYFVEDDQNNLWLGSYEGLMRVSKKALNDFAHGSTNSISCQAYGKPDGLPIGECTQGIQPAACRTRDGTLWFPTIKGLVSVNPSALKQNLYQPPVAIESVQVAGQEQNTNGLRSGWLREVTIPPHKELLEIHYTSLNLAAADRARFKYRLEPHETDWINVGGVREARYSKLPPGHYRFLVTACNEDGVWNETGASLAITVLPAFWQTGWFRGAAVACLLGIIVATVYFVSTQKLQRQLRQQRALEKDRARIARDLHDQVGANLTQVALLGELAESDKDSPGEVEGHAQQISQTARETTRALDEIVWAVNPSNDTLDGLITYACKYAQEYLAVAGLRYRLDVPPQLPGTTLPPEIRHNVFLAFKEAVNNVVKHSQASEARIRLRLDSSRFSLEIEDNGRGLNHQDEKTDRNGLRNMRKRMEDIRGEFSLGPGSEGGTLVRLTAPLRKV